MSDTITIEATDELAALEAQLPKLARASRAGQPGAAGALERALERQDVLTRAAKIERLAEEGDQQAATDAEQAAEAARRATGRDQAAAAHARRLERAERIDALAAKLDRELDDELEDRRLEHAALTAAGIMAPSRLVLGHDLAGSLLWRLHQRFKYDAMRPHMFYRRSYSAILTGEGAPKSVSQVIAESESGVSAGAPSAPLVTLPGSEDEGEQA